jgi:hypothetical protein
MMQMSDDERMNKILKRVDLNYMLLSDLMFAYTAIIILEMIMFGKNDIEMIVNNGAWQSIESAPTDKLLQGMKLTESGMSLFRCIFKDGVWRGLEFGNRMQPTHWRHNKPEDRV